MRCWVKLYVNKNFDRHLENIATEFREKADQYSTIISIHHTDADGYGSGLIIREMAQRLHIPLKQYTNNIDLPWSQYLADNDSKFLADSAVIFSDLGPSAGDLNTLAEKHPTCDIYILDHHIFRNPEDIILPDNVFNCNPTLFGLNGLKEIAGATLNYLFATEVDQKNQNMGWAAAIGMGGDTLEHFNNYRSYNRKVIEEAAELGQVEIVEGLCCFGGQYETVNKALIRSILPYVTKLNGDIGLSKTHLESLGIHPKTKVFDLSEEDARSIADSLTPDLYGEYLIFPKKKGLLRSVFDHAQVVSIVGHDNPTLAFRIMGSRTLEKEHRVKYENYIETLVKNLSRFVHLNKIKTNHAIIADLTDSIPIELWGDIGSFSTINKIYDPSKCLFIGGLDGNKVKLSVRCSPEYIEAHQGKGANQIIYEICRVIGGKGGGHPLAGGIRMTPENLVQLKSTIDNIIATL